MEGEPLWHLPKQDCCQRGPPSAVSGQDSWCLVCMSSLTADFVINSFSKLLLKFKFQNSCYKKYRWSTLSNSRICPQSSQLWSVYWLSFQTLSYAFISMLYIQINTPFWGVFLSLQTSSLILMQLALLIKNMAWKKYVFEIFLNQYLEIYFLVFNCDMLNILQHGVSLFICHPSPVDC